MNPYKLFLKPLLFLMPPEKAHGFIMTMLNIILAIPGKRWFFRKVFQINDPGLKRQFLGLEFKNPVGLAAGFDKNAEYINTMSELGFGFIEVGTVTPKAQDGNPQPRLFRLPSDEALINRMGFNNGGLELMVENLKKERPKGLIIGGNIGKNKSTSNTEAVNDYSTCFETLFPHVDYFVVNVSSPNTPNLRELQDKEPLTQLLNRMVNLNQMKLKPKPILLKIAPDLTDTQLDDIIDIVTGSGIEGIIATNTTIGRDGLVTSASKIDSIGNGGLSGKPLRNRSTEVIRYLHEKSGGKIFIIGVGGIGSPKDAIEKLEAGASLVQIYSGLIFAGPGLVRNINKEILRHWPAHS